VDTFNVGSAVGEGFVNSGTAAHPTLVHEKTSLVRIVIKADPSSPYGFIIITTIPNYGGRSKVDESQNETVYPQSVWSENLDDLELARKFVNFIVQDTATVEEVKDESFKNRSPAMLEEYIKGLEAVEKIANESQQPGILFNIVGWDAGYMLPNDTEEEARLWLLEFAEFVRDVLRDREPPRKYPMEVFHPRCYFYPE
jgi:hypothetical protein